VEAEKLTAMSLRTTILLLVAVIVIGVYIQFGERRRENTDERKAAARLAVKFDPDRVTGLRLESPAGLFILVKTNHSWRLTSPVLANADDASILLILDTLAGLRRSEMISPEEMRELKIDVSDYGFHPPRVKIGITGTGTELEILIGRDAPGGKQLYVKHANMDEIIVTSRDILATLPGSVLDMRDRRLFSGHPGGIKRIELQAGDKVLHAARNEADQWNIDRPLYARGASNVIRQWLDGLYEFRIEDFIADSVAAGSLYGFDTPIAQLSLLTDSRSVPQILKIGRAADVAETTYYATLVGQDAVFSVSQQVVDWLQKNTSDFRDNRLLAMPAMNIGYIEMSDGERILQLARSTQNVWEVISPKKFLADDMKIQRLLSTWSGAKVNRFIDSPALETNAVTMADTKTYIRFSLQTPLPSTTETGSETNNHHVVNEHADVTFMIGSTNGSQSVVMTMAGRAYLMELSSTLLDAFTLNPLEFRDPVVLSIAPGELRRISQKSGTLETLVERTNILFRTKSPQEVPDTGAVDEIISEVTRLMAARLVEEDPPDLSIYGLDNPTRQLVLGVSGATGINKVIQFGHSTGYGETYAKIQGTDMVFTLTDRVVNILTKPVANQLLPPSAEPLTPGTE